MPTITFAGDTTQTFVANHLVPSYNATVQNNTNQTITITVTNDDIQAAGPTFITPAQGAVVIAAGSNAAITNQYEGWLLTAGAAATGTVGIVESGFGGAAGSGGGLGYTAYFGGSWGTGVNTDFARVSTVAGGSVDVAAAEENNFVVPATGTITKISWSKQNTGGTYTMKINYGASNTTFQPASGSATGVNTVSLAVTEGDIITIQQNGTDDAIGDAGFCVYIS
jgi:hypothetical protein